jgi:hypothetical protein
MTETWHPSEDELVLRLCGEAGEALSRQIDAHLQGCDVCRTTWSEFSDTLALAGRAAVPDPPEGFERVMWARVERALPPGRPGGAAWRMWLPALAFAALVVIIATLGARPDRSAPTGTPPATKTADARTAHERVLLTAMDDHLAQTELLLVELMNAPEHDAEGPALVFERVTANDLVAAGRLYRATAVQTGNRVVADVLDELEPVLVEVARSPDRPNPQDLNSLRTRIDRDALLFKVRAVTQDIHERQQEIAIAHEGH